MYTNSQGGIWCSAGGVVWIATGPGADDLALGYRSGGMGIAGVKQTAAAYLLGKGDLLYQVDAQLHRLQSLFASTIQLP